MDQALSRTLRGNFAGSSAELLLPCDDLFATVQFFTEALGFGVDTIFPAEGPVVAVLAGHGVRLRLDTHHQGDPGRLRLTVADPAAVAPSPSLRAPNGTVIDLVATPPGMVVPPLAPSLSISRAGAAGEWAVGRAGMRYRDLLPERQGGRFVASVIHVEQGGPLPDYPHYHKIRFQMIFCLTGVATLVYEDQGPPFAFRAGDCVLQPPEIRHRVLDATSGFEVVELGCPAEHTTRGDPEMTLPTTALSPNRLFGGQRFVRHDASVAPWTAWRHPGYERQDFGFMAATDGLAEASVVRAVAAPAMAPSRHDGELQFWFIIAGSATVALAGHPDLDLAANDSIAIPPGQVHQLMAVSPDFCFLEVRL